ncbi:histidine kinase dimerization/phosphoacceptor domain -containing protein [Methanococcoides alaskense]|uniref:histidine kinase n=1 Tax=Methanococcoides alaskense TaxID=325778 RepID=A0AA90ZDP0_9EURY|nr:histidine kinase dimerization/phosphoacceptor domain -containing protein [Methanococcoides alaskense]MDA0524193.1 PAS domain-containing protein [Methanococcoides alaskense]MDR6223688.1 PAS domain S-box-containing protein [Methanococcoides alaskense]
MDWKNTSLKSKLILFIVVGVLLVLVTSTSVIISTVTSQEETLAYEQSIEKARGFANYFDSDMRKNHAIGQTIANSMNAYNSANRDEVNDILKEVAVRNPNLLGTYVCYEPNAFDGNDQLFINAEGHDETGRFIPYWNRINGDLTIDPLLNYEESDYYQLPKMTKVDHIIDPYFYEGVFIVSYVTPIFKDDEFVGIGGVDVSLTYLDEVVSEVKIFDTGYAFMTGNTGILISQPEQKDWIGYRTLYDFDVPEITAMADEIKVGNCGFIDTIDPTTGKTVVMFYEPIKTGNFSFVLVVPKDEMLAGVTELRNNLIVISTISILFMTGLAAIIAGFVTRPINEIVADFKDLSDAAVVGELHARADTDVDIDFKNIPLGLNEILDAFTQPMTETMRVTNELAKGELQTRVATDLKGEFKHIGDTLDSFATMINAIIDESNAVLTAFQNEDFTRKIKLKGEGDFRILTDGIEKTRKSLYSATTERQKAEEELIRYSKELEQSNQMKEEMERVVENSPIIVFKWRAEKGWPIDFVSKNISQFGYSTEDFASGKVTYADIVYPQDLPRVEEQLQKKCDEGANEFTIEYRILTKYGKIVWADERTFIRRDAEGNVDYLQGIIVNIDERKRAEEALLKVEEIRKKEIHHRIKNNLQVISTLLYLESDKFKDKKVRDAFKNSQDRVRTMALVHEKLYQSEDMESIDFADYTKNLITYLSQSYVVGNRNIAIELDVADVFLNMDTAVPLGIIINELVSNSLKYAFEDKDENEKGIISVDIEHRGDDFMLTVSDNGSGIPDDIDFRDTESLGLQLVTNLVEQIDGNIELKKDNGTKFIIQFTEEKYN